MSTMRERLFNTYSIVARDPETGDLGVAVQTHQLGVGRVVPWALAGVGALATQSMTNVRYGPMGLTMLREGVSAPKVIAALTATDDRAERRQLAVVDAQGQAAAWTGSKCIPEAGHRVGDGYSVQANMMLKPTVVEAMAFAYEAKEGDLAERLMAALQAAQEQGGDIRGMQSAVLKIVSGKKDEAPSEAQTKTIYDLRVDHHENPIAELAFLTRLRAGQLLDYQGWTAYDAEDYQAARGFWVSAREKAPELLELGFWHAVSLADKPAAVDEAAEIFRSSITSAQDAAHYVELLRRVENNGLLDRSGSGTELLAKLEE